MTVQPMCLDLTDAQFERISSLLQSACGIALNTGKQELVRGRLAKRLRALGMSNFTDYLAYLEGDASGEELTHMVDVLTTNKTSFFREPQHFEHLAQEVLAALVERGGPMRLWSAGCSSGEEPYTLAIVLCEQLPEDARREARILATDICTRMVAATREAVYSEEALRGLPPALVQRHFVRVGADRPRRYRVADHARRLVRPARLNLMEPWPMTGPFDIIFCRNVMIYFDRPTRQGLVERFRDILAPDGRLFVGHSESLTGMSHGLRYVQPAVYAK